MLFHLETHIMHSSNPFHIQTAVLHTISYTVVLMRLTHSLRDVLIGVWTLSTILLHPMVILMVTELMLQVCENVASWTTSLD